MTRTKRKPTTKRVTPRDLLEFFYPIQYQIGPALEDVLAAGVLSRKQVAILWLIRSEGTDGREMPRRDIEQALRSWHEISSSAVSKALREMCGKPLGFVEIRESPDSGREKLVSLTAKGAAFLEKTTVGAEEYVADVIEDVSADVLVGGAEFLRDITDAHRRLSRGEKI